MQQRWSIHSPYDGSLVDEVDGHGPEDAFCAVAAASAALRREPLPLWRRAEILDAAAFQLSLGRDEFARTIALEAAKPIRAARAEVDRAVATFQFAAAECRTLAGDVVPLDAGPVGEGKIGFTLRVPIGVVGAIAPFNFPLNLAVHKVAPAIAAGCPVVLKPAERTPLTAIRLARLLIDECGLPADYLQVLVGDGKTLGRAIVDHPDVALITFTGSPAVGWEIRAQAPRKRVALELGNNSPAIVEPDTDWSMAAEKVGTAGYSYAGQTCISTQRVYVHESIADEFVTLIAQKAESLVLGSPLDEATDVSSLISTTETRRVQAWISEALEAGAHLVTGGDTTVDGILRPTVVSHVTPDMRLCSDEVFGPVIAVATYRELDDALQLANDSRFGLQASIFTSDLRKAMRAAMELDFGGVLINEVPTWRADNQPYGGRRDSGNTREGPASAIMEMTESRLIVLSS